jgi:hypothetical protein
MRQEDEWQDSVKKPLPEPGGRGTVSYKGWMKLGGFLGLVAAALIGAAITHDNITGAALLLYPAGVILGLAIAHMTAVRKVERQFGPPPTPKDVYKATRE